MAHLKTYCYIPLWQNKALRLESLYQEMYILAGRHSSVVSSAPTILWPRVRILSTPSMLFSICVEIVTRKERK